MAELIIAPKKKTLILRDYQELAAQYALNTDMCVLALCPGGGKTEIATFFLKELLRRNPEKRALVLPHSTNVLKSNFIERLESFRNLYFTFSENLEEDVQVHIVLPQNIDRILNQYDILIVDEAHENYLAKQIQEIKQKITRRGQVLKELLLTGTPAKFIQRGGYNIYTIAANEIAEEYFAKLNIELVASHYSWFKELNNEGEVNERYRFIAKDTEATLENVILKLIERVQKKLPAHEFNNTNIISKIKESWVYTFRKLEKTMIICKRLNQAQQTYNVLLKHGVNALISDSETDQSSINMKYFKDETPIFANNTEKCDVIVVVNRGRLGFSDDNLYNIIDMSGTHNPNMIYQIFARVLRGGPHMQKYYLKVTPQEPGMMDYTHACVSAALMLTDNRYLSTYNGKNFTGIRIPVLKKKRDRVEREQTDVERPKVNKKFYFPEFTNDVIDMFKNILHDLDKPASIYKWTSIFEVRKRLTGQRVWTKAEIVASAAGLVEDSDKWIEFVNNYEPIENGFEI